jgi:hypothetical protein
MEHKMNQTLDDIMIVVAIKGIMSEETDEALIPEAFFNFPATALTIFCQALILFSELIPDYLYHALELISQFSDSAILQSVTAATHATTLLSLALAAASVFDEVRVGHLFMITRTPVEQCPNTELCSARLQAMCNLIDAFGVQLGPNIHILDAGMCCNLPSFQSIQLLGAASEEAAAVDEGALLDNDRLLVPAVLGLF